MRPQIDLLILDAHGVVLNAYWPRFLRQIASLSDETVSEVVCRWLDRVRRDAWLGRITDDELWRRLIPAHYESHDWQAILEAGYTCGPAVPHLRRWASYVPVWLLSNHRSHWLLPRLNRFDLLGSFERILVSDAIGAAKPESEAFTVLLRQSSHAKHVLFVDDQARNVEAARRLGIHALHAHISSEWVADVDDFIGVCPATHDT